ncbi:MAG: KOW domain-containing RNA-binding protein [Bacillota bacterium]|jgi:ribosomal protein L14E/L6E/L27E|nr:KOW domain-containing RNA-binding protein [Bacillota bacterium]HHT90023.1 KOW domain-containing protein [Bacillota bacterium]
MGLLEIGQLVTSKMGRDSGKKYVVVEFQDDSHVIVADGFVRKLNRPKRKNRKHLVAHNIRLDVEEWDDKAIRDFLEQHSNVEEVGKEGFTDHGQG